MFGSKRSHSPTAATREPDSYSTERGEHIEMHEASANKMAANVLLEFKHMQMAIHLTETPKSLNSICTETQCNAKKNCLWALGIVKNVFKNNIKYRKRKKT